MWFYINFKFKKKKNNWNFKINKFFFCIEWSLFFYNHNSLWLFLAFLTNYSYKIWWFGLQISISPPLYIYIIESSAFRNRAFHNVSCFSYVACFLIINILFFIYICIFYIYIFFLIEYIIISFKIMIIYIFIYYCIEYLKNVWLYFIKFISHIVKFKIKKCTIPV